MNQFSFKIKLNLFSSFPLLLRASREQRQRERGVAERKGRGSSPGVRPVDDGESFGRGGFRRRCSAEVWPEGVRPRELRRGISASSPASFPFFMKSSLHVINHWSSLLKLKFGRKRSYILSRSLLLSSFCCVEDKLFDFEETISVNANVLSNAKTSLDEFEEHNISYHANSFDKDCLTSSDSKANIEEIRIIRLILENHGWKLGSQNNYRIDLNQSNVIKIMDILFEESSDASIVLYFFRWSEFLMEAKHSLNSVCRMIHILISSNMNHIAVDLILDIVRNSEVEEGSCCEMMKIFYKTRINRKVLETVYSMLVNSYIKEKMVFVALIWTYQMKNFNTFPSRWVCKSLLKALLELNQLDSAWDLLQEMQDQGICVDASIISLFIHQYCLEGNFISGWKMLVDMKHYGLSPDPVAWTIMIDYLCKKSHLKVATTLLFKMKEFGISHDSVTVSSIIDGYCKVGKSVKATNILNIFNLPLNIYVYNSFLSQLCANGNMVQASEIFREMFEFGLRPDCISYSTMISGYCKVRDITSAFQYLAKMFKNGIQPSVITYTMLIDTFCKVKDMEMAESVFRKMIAGGSRPDTVAYNTLIDGYAKSGELHKAFEFLDIMRSDNIEPDVVTYNTLINGLILRGFVKEAKDILDELVRRGFSVDVMTCTNVINGFSKRGNFDEAFLIWCYMTENCIKPDVVTCSALLHGYCREDRMTEANILFHKMLDIGLAPDVILFNTLIHGFCRIGDMNEAGNLVKMMIEQEMLPNNITYRALVLGFEKRRVSNPAKSASLKLQEILLSHGIHVDDNVYL